jgi:uncharacterized protein YkwD
VGGRQDGRNEKHFDLTLSQPYVSISITETPTTTHGEVQLTVVTGRGANEVWVNFDRINNGRGTGRLSRGTMVSENSSSRTWEINFRPEAWVAQQVEVAYNRTFSWSGATTQVFNLTLGSTQQSTPTTTHSPTPTPTPNPTPTPTPQPVDAAAFEQEVFRLVNIERSNNGIDPLQWNDHLAGAARTHSADMATRNYFSHISPDGVGPDTRISNARIGISYRTWAENCANGQRTPEAVVDTWMNSPGHKAKILNPALTHIGVGFHNYYWTQKFAG